VHGASIGGDEKYGGGGSGSESSGSPVGTVFGALLVMLVLGGLATLAYRKLRAGRGPGGHHYKVGAAAAAKAWGGVSVAFSVRCTIRCDSRLPTPCLFLSSESEDGHASTGGGG
jgi:hypothetical protein